MRWQFPPNPDPKSFSALATEFLLWARAEFSFSRESIAKYGECLKQIWFAVGDKSISDFSQTDLLSLRSRWLDRNLSASRQKSLLLALRRFLLFCRDKKNVSIQFEPLEIKPPPKPKRDVVFLTPEEVEQFVST